MTTKERTANLAQRARRAAPWGVAVVAVTVAGVALAHPAPHCACPPPQSSTAETLTPAPCPEGVTAGAVCLTQPAADPGVCEGEHADPAAPPIGLLPEKGGHR